MRKGASRLLPSWVRVGLKKTLARLRLSRARRHGLVSVPRPAAFEPGSRKIRVLFFHPRGLHFGGTEKFLQIIATHLAPERFEVFFMCAPEHYRERESYFSGTVVNIIPFSYGRMTEYPINFLTDMTPTLESVLRDRAIDVIVGAGPGHPEFPLACVTTTPIVFINIFGSINSQSNVVRHLCVSEAVAQVVREVLPPERVSVTYNQSEGPDAEAGERGNELRARLGLSAEDVVFGRIGRPDDTIFDPIGILAFRDIVESYPQAHYVIVAPPPALVRWVEERHIPRVHLLPVLPTEAQVWAFHSAIDVLAHFRRDGESLGLNIAESMLAAKPVITHRSRYWNAHLEYLKPEFSWVAAVDNSKEYAQYMRSALALGREGLAQKGQLASIAARKLFLIDATIPTIEKYINEAAHV